VTAFELYQPPCTIIFLPATSTHKMVSQRLSSLSAVRKQHLLVELYADSSLPKPFNQLISSHSSSLKYACPHGVFMSLTPGDPTLWSGVIFVRKGAYSPLAIPLLLGAKQPANKRKIRTLRPRNPPFPNLLPPNLPLAPTSRNLQH
jgi:hypothetical protein